MNELLWTLQTTPLRVYTIWTLFTLHFNPILGSPSVAQDGLEPSILLSQPPRAGTTLSTLAWLLSFDFTYSVPLASALD